MIELLEIENAFFDLTKRGIACALATVVCVAGSSSRKPGARMLISDGGEIVAGCVSGGCLGADVAEWAERVIQNQQPKLLTYGTSDDVSPLNDKLFELGTGCEGIIEILVEPSRTFEFPLKVAASAARSGRPCTMVTVFKSDTPANLGCHLILDSVRRAVWKSDTLGHEPQLFQAALESMRGHRSSYNVADTPYGKVEYFCEYIDIPPKVLVCGAGLDAVPVVKLAHEIGWRVTVLDHRASHATLARFPDADELVITRPSELLRKVEITDRTAIVLMTHNYSLDRDLLAEFIDHPTFYIGLLGSRKRLDQIIGDLDNRGIDIRRTFGKRFRAPIGLDLGATTPETIALAVVSEIQAVLAGRSAGSLTGANRIFSINDSVMLRETGAKPSANFKREVNKKCPLSA